MVHARLALTRSWIVALVLATGVVGAPAPATAALPNCARYASWNKFFQHELGSSWVNIPDVGRPGGAGDMNCTMRQGARGGGVEALQRALHSCYKRPIAVDGVWGSQTTAALKYAQGIERVQADGVYGPITLQNIAWPVTTSPLRCVERYY